MKWRRVTSGDRVQYVTDGANGVRQTEQHRLDVLIEQGQDPFTYPNAPWRTPLGVITSKAGWGLRGYSVTILGITEAEDSTFDVETLKAAKAYAERRITGV
tara:strand:+ start:588 stop:890 length:303 start_codon:yes stop_codon:yes gene_type:complete